VCACELVVAAAAAAAAAAAVFVIVLQTVRVLVASKHYVAV
jgi:hypothetical protein